MVLLQGALTVKAVATLPNTVEIKQFVATVTGNMKPGPAKM